MSECQLYDHSSPQDLGLGVLDMNANMNIICPNSKPQQQSTFSILSPVPEWILWDSELTEIELVNTREVLGFSLLDFSVR